ncbi:tRNA (adenosine(37)-N6)-dimethylallyltransferase MiaA [Nonlabens xiamenensis]|uniref:tRNA (adenosine(37)-N6)-dimethylallyltransferase MiaA n=1 Tax=Nonlabens xiamenensis TaxID=2341043 RepID=UPI000F611DCD|nr:tRNA (adenosine(37)-N6)-dimethylallyltransferase MiaA [Nonlabens xiamenensis]
MSIKTLICIVGPTGIGKTALSIAFAKAYNTSILSSDSRQFYKEMTIGTAVPEKEELEAAPHHFIQNRSIHDAYSVGDFEREVTQLLPELFHKNKLLIMVGGSALYEKAVTHGLDDLPEVPSEVLQSITAEFEQHGLPWLQEMVKQVDPVFYAQTDVQNPRRLLRALSVYNATGKRLSSLQTGTPRQRDFNVIKVGLYAERPALYERINQRVDRMVEIGLAEEAKRLYPYRHLKALQTVGYQEFFGEFDGLHNRAESIRLVKRNTRRFAKRQLTWYRKDKDVHWFHYQTCHTEIIRQVSGLLME